MDRPMQRFIVVQDRLCKTLCCFQIDCALDWQPPVLYRQLAVAGSISSPSLPAWSRLALLCSQSWYFSVCQTRFASRQHSGPFSEHWPPDRIQEVKPSSDKIRSLLRAASWLLQLLLFMFVPCAVLDFVGHLQLQLSCLQKLASERFDNSRPFIEHRPLDRKRGQWAAGQRTARTVHMRRS